MEDCQAPEAAASPVWCAAQTQRAARGGGQEAFSLLLGF